VNVSEGEGGEDGGEVANQEADEDIYGGTDPNTSKNGQVDMKDGDDDNEDDDEDVQIVLDTESVENRVSYGRGGGVGVGMGAGSAPNSTGKPHYGRGGPLIMAGAGGSYPLKRPQPQTPSGKFQKSVFEFDIDSLEDKPWRKSGVDITDYFNYGFNEESWRAYSEKQAQMRLEQSMQSKIKVFDPKENVRSELPPELQAMVDGEKNNSVDAFRKRPIPPRGRVPVDDWQNRGGFDHRRRVRDQDDAVIQINTSMDIGDDNMARNTPERPDMTGMDEFYVPTGMPFPRGGGGGGGFPDYSREPDRRREEERKRGRASRSPRRDDREKERDRDRDKRRDDRERRREGSVERDRRRERDEKEREKEDYKRKSSSSVATTREEDERAKRRR